MNEADFGREWLFNSFTQDATPLDQGFGILDSDFVLYVSAENVATCVSSNASAWAQPCVQDQYGRPVVGAINFCSTFFVDKYWKEDALLALHEIMHTLVFAPDLFDDFIDSDGNTIDRANVVDDTGSREYIITNQVKTRAQAHFNCFTDAIMPGLPLEDNGAPGQGISGWHWEERYMVSEFMVGKDDTAQMHVSEFTLALMEDSGWYVIDYDFSDPFFWGKNAGCDFLDNTVDCVDKTTHKTNFYPFFCDDIGDKGCNHEYTAPAGCKMSSYAAGVIPAQFQYYVC